MTTRLWSVSWLQVGLAEVCVWHGVPLTVLLLAAITNKRPQFVEFAKEVCERLAVLGHWADYIDPCRWGPSSGSGASLAHPCIDGAASVGSSVLPHHRRPRSPCPSLCCCRRSGLPMIHRGTNAVYGEVEAAATLLGYRTQNAGCCKVGAA